MLKSLSGEQCYTSREVQKTTGLSSRQIKLWIEAGFISPGRNARDAYLFTFQDLILLRTARVLHTSTIPARRIRRALQKIRDELPSQSLLQNLHITTENNQVILKNNRISWVAESGQILIDFEISSPGFGVVHAMSLPRKNIKSIRDSVWRWFEQGCQQEAEQAEEEALQSYLSALALDETHTPSHANAARLFHERGDFENASYHYRKSLALLPDDSIVAFNFAVLLEDQNRITDAIAAYEQVVKIDSSMAHAHYNVAKLYETLGSAKEALRHLSAYRRLTRTD